MKKIVQPVQKTENADVVAVSPLAATGVEKMILVIRDKQVLLDRDLATLYGVQTKRIKEQVKRNIARFPEDFCFELSESEFAQWRSQIATSIADRKGLRYAPFAFTEEGVAMPDSEWPKARSRCCLCAARRYRRLPPHVRGTAETVT